MIITNRFGTGQIYTIDELLKEEYNANKVFAYCESNACLSVTSDIMSWTNDKRYDEEIAFVPKNAPENNSIIIVLGCQVTDLAILNDIKRAEQLHEENPTAKLYIGGCIAYRFDIELPTYARRLATVRCEYKEIEESKASNIQWNKPFWIKDSEWKDTDDEFMDGHLFRHMYPLKIGAGCSGKCKYCTIKDTRGNRYEADAYMQVDEFLSHDNIVLVSDSPTSKQIIDWCNIAEKYNKSISVRNVEPHVVIKCKHNIYNLAQKGLLKILHCPIQSNNTELLKVMNRDVDTTLQFIEFAQELRKLDVKVATNIIIDYKVNNGNEVVVYKNMDTEFMNNNFDYWVWNPYFDGKFCREKAEKRFKKYIYDN